MDVGEVALDPDTAVALGADPRAELSRQLSVEMLDCPPESDNIQECIDEDNFNDIVRGAHGYVLRRGSGSFC